MTITVLISLKNYLKLTLNHLDDTISNFEEYLSDDTLFYLRDLYTEYSLAYNELDEKIKSCCKLDTTNLLKEKYNINLKE